MLMLNLESRNSRIERAAYHSGGLNGIFLLNIKIKAARIQSTMHTMTGTNMSPWMPHAPRINGKIPEKANYTGKKLINEWKWKCAIFLPHARAPHANWRPISERPVDVSRVAIITAVFNSTMIETGKISAIDRINRYDQYVTSMSPSICIRREKRKHFSIKINAFLDISLELSQSFSFYIHDSIYFEPKHLVYYMDRTIRTRSSVCSLGHL